MTMETEFEEACQNGKTPGMVCLASNKSGSYRYERSFGVRTLDPAAGSPALRPPLKPDTLMRIASASKLITSVAAMICVDRGMLDLDDDVGKFDPDLGQIQLLTGFDEADRPVFIPPSEKITLRRLLTHSSGFSYDVLSPLLLKWRKFQGQQPQPSGPKLTDRFLCPLVSEPGTEWVYSPSLDWAGRVVERVSGLSLEMFIQTNIAQPLGLKKMTFFPQKHPDVLKDHADMAIRDKQSGNAIHSPEEYWEKDPDEAFGGMALFTTAEDFFKVLLSLLENDERLVSRKTRDEMLSPHLSLLAKEKLKQFLMNPGYEALGMGGDHPVGSQRDHSLVGMYLVEDLPAEKTPRRPGTSAWMGLPHFHWFIDPAAELCAVFAMQLKPSDDATGIALTKIFERTMYERMRVVA